MSDRENHQFIAHVRKSDAAIQTLDDHLIETAELCGCFASAIGLPLCGYLLGYLHDLGKYSTRFQKYIRDVVGLNGEEARAAAEKNDRGKIDHATAGAQYIWQAYRGKLIPCRLAQILSVAIMSHHSRTGMKDFIDLTGKSPFFNRLSRSDSDTHKDESVSKAHSPTLKKIDDLLQSPALIDEFNAAIHRIENMTTKEVPRENAFSLLTRYLFSCLLDADRISTSDFENQKAAGFRTFDRSPDWSSLVDTFERYISAKFAQDSEIDILRSEISEECLMASARRENLFTLQVPTGGGKTLASLRFALHRANNSETHRVDRVIYILPYTSILDQNAAKVREILGTHAVLEHHSNLSEEKDTWRNRVLSENWDSTVVFTTSVQFLNSLFAAGTKTARRMHHLSNSILIFDEIQSLPIKTVHLFNNAIQFLCGQGNTTAVLCTATMPLLQTVNSKLGALSITEENEIIQDKTALFKKLKRTTILDECRPEKWSNAQIAEHALKLQEKHQSLLIICNTKNSAHDLFELLESCVDIPVVHLSTNMCAAHRRHRIQQIREKLDVEDPQPVICISTQLIEAGVDLDFDCVIRSLAGLDSIVQAAGRCNRHGYREMGFVNILNFKEEKLGSALKDIDLAQEVTRRILHEYHDDPSSFDGDLLSEKAMNRFYKYYFYQRSGEMTYPRKADQGCPPLAQNCSLLGLLSHNSESLKEAKRTNNIAANLPFKYAFSTAAQAFQVIDAPTQGIIVPYVNDGHCGSKVIGDLAASYTNENVALADQVRLHKTAQQYTVNIFPNVIKELVKAKAIREIQPGEGIYCLDERYYHKDFGVTLKPLSKQHLLNV